MLVESAAPDEGRVNDSPLQHLVMHVLRVVTEVMVDDVALAEQLRVAALRIWLAERLTRQPRHAQVAWWDIQDNEEQLRSHLLAARRRLSLDADAYNQALILLRKAAQHRAAHMALEHAA